MKRIAVHFFRDIDCIVDSALAVDDGVLAVESVTENNGVVGVGSRTSRTGSTSGNGGVKAFATREDMDGHNHTQYQHENQ